MRLIFLIGAGGFLGAVSRYLLSLAIPSKTAAFPVGYALLYVAVSVVLGLSATYLAYQLVK